jgi:hypothetical protein
LLVFLALGLTGRMESYAAMPKPAAPATAASP